MNNTRAVQKKFFCMKYLPYLSGLIVRKISRDNKKNIKQSPSPRSCFFSLLFDFSSPPADSFVEKEETKSNSSTRPSTRNHRRCCFFGVFWSLWYPLWRYIPRLVWLLHCVIFMNPVVSILDVEAGEGFFCLWIFYGEFFRKIHNIGYKYWILSVFYAQAVNNKWVWGLYVKGSFFSHWVIKFSLGVIYVGT